MDGPGQLILTPLTDEVVTVALRNPEVLDDYHPPSFTGGGGAKDLASNSGFSWCLTLSKKAWWM